MFQGRLKECYTPPESQALTWTCIAPVLAGHHGACESLEGCFRADIMAEFDSSEGHLVNLHTGELNGLAMRGTVITTSTSMAWQHQQELHYVQVVPSFNPATSTVHMGQGTNTDR